MNRDIRVIRGRKVLWITLKQKPVNQLCARWLTETAKLIRDDPESVIFITARGRAFSAGLNLNDTESALSCGATEVPHGALQSSGDPSITYGMPYREAGGCGWGRADALRG